jgi:Uma2 family endonuclease
MSNALRWTSADLELLPDTSKCYEIVEGELYMSRQPHYHHQVTCSNISFFLKSWSDQTRAGEVSFAPGLIFADDDDVAPDVIWISAARLKQALAEDGKLHAAPELVVEVLSPGNTNERRDREAKLKLYSRHGVQEYWITDWLKRQVEVYRREQLALQLIATLYPAWLPLKLPLARQSTGLDKSPLGQPRAALAAPSSTSPTRTVGEQ